MLGIIPIWEVEQRVKRLQDALMKNELEGALILENTNLYYFSGTVFDGFLFVPAEGAPLLLANKGVERVKSESPLKEIHSIQNTRDLPLKLREHSSFPRRLGMELDVLPARDYLRYQRLFTAETKMVDISKIIREIRWIKSPYEQELIKESAEIHGQLFLEIPRLVQIGLFDWELAAQIEYRARLAGHLGITRFRGFNRELFMGAVLTGPTGATLSPSDTPFGGQGLTPLYPMGAGGGRIEKGQPVSIDYVGNYTGYMVDQTRSFCLGTPPSLLKKAYETSLEIQAMVEEEAKPGVNGAYLYEKAVSIARKNQLAEHFMGYGQPVTFIGHGIGLEINEWPVIAKGIDLLLEEGQVFALEPKFVFPKLGLVGIENTYLIRSEGLEKLTVTSEEMEL